MRFLGIGDSCDLSAIYLRLLAEGHEVKVYIAEPLCRSTLAGMVTQTADWRAELDWIRSAGDHGIVLFENAGKSRGELQDRLRREGYRVIGGSGYGDRLETDRAFAQDVLQKLGLSTCPVHPFSERNAAIEFLSEHPGRYVVKFDGGLQTFVGRLSDGRDVRAFLASAPLGHVEKFILMRHVEGIEMGVGAYFDGEKFLKPSCLDWEHKRFFPGDLGELTYEMGTVVTYERTSRFHELTLGRMDKLLRQGGYCGYINMNTIVNEAGVWPLELTCRFGYPGYAILDPLQKTAWGELFHVMATRSAETFAIKPGFSVGIVLTTPPFPYSRPAVDEPIGLPIMFDETLTEADRRHIHFCEVGLENGQLVTSGAYGWTMVVTGIGNTTAGAQQSAIALADKMHIPNVRYRKDIGSRLIAGDFRRVETLGLLDGASAENRTHGEVRRFSPVTSSYRAPKA
jgi:phosphoribosylamine---glycine ligase